MDAAIYAGRRIETDYQDTYLKTYWQRSILEKDPAMKENTLSDGRKSIGDHTCI